MYVCMYLVGEGNDGLLTCVDSLLGKQALY